MMTPSTIGGGGAQPKIGLTRRSLLLCPGGEALVSGGMALKALWIALPLWIALEALWIALPIPCAPQAATTTGFAGRARASTVVEAIVRAAGFRTKRRYVALRVHLSVHFVGFE